ncbi:MAG: response regulator [Kiritimatiellae bacterium]|jgi:CheY-like chemotaxis protein|nr:response regulator [Kiritimatiellia bacterium]MDD3441131.1 response regulator [Kiritimatiellia bacterium]NCC93874.1 response regulator [Opitutae bacterium]HOO21846.1 response regulator [Kiritimatiellia bacterium]
MIDRYILLAEDNPNDAELTIAALRESRLVCPIQVVADGAEALDFLFCRGAHAGRKGGPPAVILLDLKMPKVNGLEVLQAVKGDPSLSVIPVVMLTSSREEADLTRSYASGANAYVVKPVEFDEFLQTVRDLGLFWGRVNEPAPVPGPSAPAPRRSHKETPAT